MLAGRR